MTYVELQDGDTIKEVDFEWGEKQFPVGSEFTRIGGTKKRTSLQPGYKMKYVGMHDVHVLLLPVYEAKESVQLELFVELERIVYLAPMYIDNHCLLMQSSENGFWDIRCDN